MKKQEIYKFGQKLDINIKIINLVLEKILHLDKKQLFLIEEIAENNIEEIEKYFMRIVSGEPIEYILENANFYGLDFFVDSRVLVPRDDTEIMVDKVVEELKNTKNNILIDVGTGTSCIAISILKNIKNIEKCFVIDISKKALEVSKINIKKYSLEKKINQIKSDLLENFLINTKYLENNGTLDLEKIIITANLPYIKNEDLENIDFETHTFEPDLALYGGKKTGFELYEKLIYQILELKSIYNIKKLILFIEIGFDQKKVSENFLQKLNLSFEIFKDNHGINRCIKIFF